MTVRPRADPLQASGGVSLITNLFTSWSRRDQLLESRKKTYIGRHAPTGDCRCSRAADQASRPRQTTGTATFLHTCIINRHEPKWSVGPDGVDVHRDTLGLATAKAERPIRGECRPCWLGRKEAQPDHTGMCSDYAPHAPLLVAESGCNMPIQQRRVPGPGGEDLPLCPLRKGYSPGAKYVGMALSLSEKMPNINYLFFIFFSIFFFYLHA